MTALVIRSDAGRLPLPDASIDLVVTSPPYFALRSYTDGGEHYAGQVGAEATPSAYIAALIDCTREWVRVLKPTGSLWVNLGDKYSGYEFRSEQRPLDTTSISHQQLAAAPKTRRYTKSAPTAYGVPYKSLMGLPWRYALACMDELGLTLRRDQIWAKPNGMPESCTDRTRSAHEYWFHLVKQQKYYANLDELREPSKTQQAPRPLGTRNKTPRHTVAADYTGWKDHSVSNNPAGRIPSSVWEIATEPMRKLPGVDVDHWAAFPTEWPRRIITGWCPPAGTVLDPFGGTGTTAHVADALGRTGVSVDLSADYCRLAAHPELAEKRRRKVLALPKARPATATSVTVAPAQGSLLDLIEDGAA